MSKIYTVTREKKAQSRIALNAEPYCDVFDDRWKSNYLDPRTWQVRLNQGDHTLVQLEFLSSTQDVLLTSNDMRESMLERKGFVRKHFDFNWNGHAYRWTKRGSGYALHCSDIAESHDVAVREDTGNSEGIITTIRITTPLPALMSSKVTHVDEKHNLVLEDEIILASGLCIGAANVDGGVLTSRPPNGIWMATTGRIAMSSLGGSQMPAAQQ